MADITKTIGIIFQATDNASAAARSLEGSLKGVETAAAGAAPNIDSAAAASGKLGSTSIGITDLATAFQILAGSVVVKEFIDANVATENFGRAMEAVLGSTTAAGDAFDYVKKTANTLGLEITGAQQNFLSLTAAAKGTTLEGQATRDIFEAVSSAMAKLGKSTFETNGALLAINQVISKGTVSSEELRGQLGERIPGAFQIAARAIGVTTEELSDMLKAGEVIAVDFLPKFAAELNKTFGDPTYVTTFNAELNRLINSLKDLAVAGGDAGIFGALTDALRDLTNINKATVAEVELLAGSFKATQEFLARGGEDWESYRKAMERVRIEAGILQAAITNANESTAESARLNRLAEEAALKLARADESLAESNRLARYGDEARASVTALDDALKFLKISFEASENKSVAAFETIANSGAVTADVLTKAFAAALPKVANTEDYTKVYDALTTAAERGDISFEQWTKQVGELDAAFAKNTGAAKENAEATKKQADEAKRAEENAAKMALELEKLSSNERIKALEFRAEINVAQIQADAEKVVAAFDSISTGIESTGDVLGDVFGLFDKFDALSFQAQRVVLDQIDQENKLREQAFELQKKLTEAQIENLKAQTDNLLKGDALIKVDGAGLQPHLEAFMWEILKAIQVRVNQQGLAQLLGLP